MVFAGGFADFVVFVVVNSWCFCGEFVVKRGSLMVVFRWAGATPDFPDFFSGIGAGVALPKSCVVFGRFPN